MTVVSGAQTERTVAVSKTRSTVGDSDGEEKLLDLSTEGTNKVFKFSLNIIYVMQNLF